LVSFLEFFDDVRHHLVAALVYCPVRVLQLARRKARGQLLAHCSPSLAVGEEQTVSQHSCGWVQDKTVVGEVREVLDQYRMNQLRIADQQHRFPHLVEPKQFDAWEPIVNPVEHVSRMFELQNNSQRVAKQWYGWHMWYVQFLPFAVSRGRIAVETHDNCGQTQIGDIFQ